MILQSIQDNISSSMKYYLSYISSVIIFLINSLSTTGCGVDCPQKEVWALDPNTYIYGMPPIEYIEETGGTVTVWSVYHGGYNEEEHEYLELLHNEGVRCASNFPTMQGSLSVTGDMNLAERTACRDINGEPAKAYWIVTEDVYLPCHNNPEWRDFLKERLIEHLEGGVDAVHIDEIEGIGGHLYVAGFCDYCVEGFRNFLIERFTPEEAKEIFGIEDLETFSYRDYIRELGGSTPYSDPNVELRSQFVLFQLKSREEMLEELIDLGRDWTCNRVLFSGNTFNLSPNKHPFVESLDLLVFENDMEFPPYKNIGTYMLGKSLSGGKRLVMFPDILTLADLMDEDPSVFRTFIEESFGVGEAFLLPYNAYTLGGEFYTLDPVVISDLLAFLREKEELIIGGERIGLVGVLYDFQSAMREYRDEGFIYPWLVGGDSHASYLGICQILTNGHIPFDTLYSGDSNFIEKTPDLTELLKYPLILLPISSSMNYKTEEVINDYQIWGGKVLEVGLLSLQYYKEREDWVQEEVLDEVLSLLGNPIETDAPPEVGIFPWIKDDSVVFVVVNYMREDGEVTPSPSFRYSIHIPTMYDLNIGMLFLETIDGTIESLPFSYIDGVLEFELPELGEFGIIYSER